MSIQPALSDKQLSFLNTYYRVLNPTTCESSTNFDKLLTCSKILVGEFHHTAIGRHVQLELLRLFKERTCVLLEDLMPALRVHQEHLNEFRELPDNFVLRGSDIRGKRSAVDYNFVTNHSWALTLTYLKYIKCLHDLVTKFSAMLNDAFKQGTASIESGHLIVDEALLQTFCAGYEELRAELDPVLHELKTLIKSKEDPVERKQQFRIKESNTFLIREIVKTARTFPRVIAIWGADHLRGESAFEQHLGKAGEDFMVLVPSAYFKALGEQEHEVYNPTFPYLTVHKKTPEGLLPVEFTLFPSCLALLPSAVEELCILPRKYPSIQFSPEALKNSFTESGTYTYPGYHSLVFTGIDYDVYCSYCELFEPIVMDKAGLLPLVKAINTIFVFCGMSLIQLEFDATPAYNLECIDHTPSIMFTTDGEAHLTIDRSNIRIEPKIFFDEMKRRSINNYHIDIGTTLVFENFDPVYIRNILADPSALTIYLNDYVPPKMYVDIEGTINLTSDRSNGTACLNIKALSDTSITLIQG